MKFVFEFMTQTQLGQIFGVSSHKIGGWLKKMGLRNEHGHPTVRAHKEGFCKQAPSSAGFHWVWNSGRTVQSIIGAGYSPVPNPPPFLVRPAILKGPFSVQKSSGPEFVIESSDGSVSLWANNRMTADVIVRILNMAHEKGVVDRLCQPQRLLQMPLASEDEICSLVTPFEEREEESIPARATPLHSNNDNI